MRMLMTINCIDYTGLGIDRTIDHVKLQALLMSRVKPKCKEIPLGCDFKTIIKYYIKFASETIYASQLAIHTLQVHKDYWCSVNSQQLLGC